MSWVKRILFPVFVVIHGSCWQICKHSQVYIDKDGMRTLVGIGIQMFGLPDTKIVLDSKKNDERSMSFRGRVQNKIMRSFSRKHLRSQQKQQNHQQEARMALMRELNLVLGLLSFFMAPQVFERAASAKASTIESLRTQVLFLESIMFGWAAFDSFQKYQVEGNNAGNSSIVVIWLLLFLLATLGIFGHAGSDAMGAVLKKSKSSESTFQDYQDRGSFERLPDDVQVLMMNEDASTTETEHDEGLDVFPGESSITATIFKPSPDSLVGLSFQRVPSSWRIVISKLASDGVYAMSCHKAQKPVALKVGMTILSINGVSAEHLSSPKEVATLIQQSTHEVTIVATKSILVQLPKASIETKCGFSFQQRKVESGSEKKQNRLRLHKIHSKSLLQGSEMKEGMRILAINHEYSPSTLNEVGELVRNTVGTLVLLAVDDERVSYGDQSTTMIAPQSSPTTSTSL